LAAVRTTTWHNAAADPEVPSPAPRRSFKHVNRTIAMSLRTIFLCVVQLLFVFPAMAADLSDANIGGVPIKLPVPASFVDVASVAPAIQQLGVTLTPPGNRLLAMFATAADAKRSNAGKPPALDRYFLVQTMRQAEGAIASAAEFNSVREALRGQLKELLDKNRAGVQQGLDKIAADVGKKTNDGKLSFKMGEIQARGMYIDQDNAIGMLTLVKFNMIKDGKPSEVPMAIGTTVVHLKGKALFFYAYAKYHSAADEEWIRSVSKDWTNTVLEAN
jgi:hypothetical protein